MNDPRYVYGQCIGLSDRSERCLEPSLDAYGLGPRIALRGQPDIFTAYNHLAPLRVRKHRMDCGRKEAGDARPYGLLRRWGMFR